MAYRAEQLAARERADRLEEELLEAEAELERRAEQLDAFELRMREQMRRQQAEDTQKTRAVVVESRPTPRSRRMVMLALGLGTVLGATVATTVTLWVTSDSPEPSRVQTRLVERPILDRDITGSLSLTCIPGCRKVIVGGRSLGPTPILNHQVRAGIHRVAVTAGDTTKLVLVQVTAGKTTTHVIRF